MEDDRPGSLCLGRSAHDRIVCRRGLRFLDLPPPAGDLYVPYGSPTAVAGRPHRGYHVPHEGDAVGSGASCTPGSRFPTAGRKQSRFRYDPVKSSPYQPSFSVTPNNDASNGGSSRHPFDLRLARISPMTGSFLRLCPQLHTSLLPEMHVRTGDKTGHCLEFYLITPFMRLHVASLPFWSRPPASWACSTLRTLDGRSLAFSLPVSARADPD